jgi:hypothetical protein
MFFSAFHLSDVSVLENEVKESVGQLGAHDGLQVQLQALQHVVRVLCHPVVDSPEKNGLNPSNKVKTSKIGNWSN